MSKLVPMPNFPGWRVDFDESRMVYRSGNGNEVAHRLTYINSRWHYQRDCDKEPIELMLFLQDEINKGFTVWFANLLVEDQGDT